MPNFLAARAFALAALVTLLAACSGNSALFAPSTSAPGPTQAAAARHALLEKKISPFASKRATALFAAVKPLVNLSNRGFLPIGTKKPSAAFVFASDNFTGNVDAYDPASGALVSQCAGCGGWGLAVSPKGTLAIGDFDGNVTLWTIGANSLTKFATCTLSLGASGYAADGIAFDSKGNLYADDYPANAIDFWSKAAIAAGCGMPTRTVYTSNLQVIYYLATVKARTLLATGYDSGENVDLVSVNQKTGIDKILQTVGNLSQGTGFPGGVAVDNASNAYVNNQYGSITEYPNGGVGKQSDSCTWTFSPDDYTAIATNATGTALWAANINFGSSQLLTYAEEDTIPLGGAACSTIGDTTPAQLSEEYLGIAVYPAGKT
jgi:hypothetical protein